MSQKQTIEIITQNDGTKLLVVTDYAEIGPQTWQELTSTVNPNQVTEIELSRVGVIHTHAFSQFTSLKRLIFKTRPYEIKSHMIEGCFQMKKIRLPLDGKKLKVWKEPFYKFNSLMLPRKDRNEMVFRWKEIEEWIDSPIEEDEQEKAQAQQQLVVDHGWVDDFEQVCLYWMGNAPGNYSEMDAFTRIYSMYVPGYTKEQAVMARIVKKPAGATIKLHDPDHWMLTGDIRNFFSYEPVIVIPQAEKVGEGIPLTVEFRGKEYAITGWGKSRYQTLHDFILPQLKFNKQRGEPKIEKIEVLKFEYPWNEERAAAYGEREFEWDDMKDMKMQEFLCCVMSGEIDPTRIIKVCENGF